MKILILLSVLLSPLLAGATEPIGVIICQVTGIPMNAGVQSSTWTNTTGQTLYIHRAELHMIGPDGDQAFASHLWRISDNSIFIMEGIYCTTESPHVYPKSFEPDCVSIKAGDGILLQTAVGYSGTPVVAFSTYCVVWYSVGAP